MYSYSRQCNKEAPVRSLLSRSWRGENARSAPFERLLSPPDLETTAPTALPGFTRFGAKDSADAAKEAHGQAQASSSNSDIESSDFDGDGGTRSSTGLELHQDNVLGNVEFVRLDDLTDFGRPTRDRRYYPSEAAVTLNSQQYQNVSGPIPNDAEAVAIVVVDLVGPQSRAGKYREPHV